MIDSEYSVVVGDQRVLLWGIDEPVVPDLGGEGEQALGDPHEEAEVSAAAVSRSDNSGASRLLRSPCMRRVIIDISVSIDGFSAGPDFGVAQPMGAVRDSRTRSRSAMVDRAPSRRRSCGRLS